MPRGRAGGALSISQLEGILAQRRNELAKLTKKRSLMERELKKLDREIEKLGGGRAGARSRGGRGLNTKSLTTLLVEALQKHGKPMPVGDLMQKVLASGYHTISANFRGIVNQTLIKDKRFASAERGVYQLKK